MQPTRETLLALRERDTDPFASFQVSLNQVRRLAQRHATKMVQVEFDALRARFPKRRWSFVQGMGARYVLVDPSDGWLMPRYGILSQDELSRWRSWGWPQRFKCLAWLVERIERIYFIADELDERFREDIGDIQGPPALASQEATHV